jgi:hypothetical protein
MKQLLNQLGQGMKPISLYLWYPLTQLNELDAVENIIKHIY